MTPFVVKPDARVAPTQDEFDAWVAHPTTRFVAAAWEAAAKAQREHWAAISWTSVEPSQITLIECRTRADAYMAFLESGLAEYVGIIEKDR